MSAEDKQYKDFVIGNPDSDAADRFFIQLFDRIMTQKRKGDMSLYKLYKDDKTFAAQLQASVRRIIDNGDYLLRL